MAFSDKTMRGLTRYLPGTKRDGAAVPRLIVFPQDITPVIAPMHLRPVEVPSGTLADGDYWHDDDNHTLAWYNGSANIEALHTGSTAQTKAGALTVTGALTASSTVAVTGAISGPRKIYTTTQILTAADSGAHCVFSVSTVTTYTLPAAAQGLHFKFSVRTTAAGTADIFRIVCTTGDFFVGSFIQSTDGTYTSAAHAANGSTHLAWEGNGSTTGGLAGDWLEVTASDSTLWEVFGMGRATGSEASPWKTS